jgi:hypothetical protein
VDVAAAAGLVEVIAVEAAGLPAVGVVDSVFPAEEGRMISMCMAMTVTCSEMNRARLGADHDHDHDQSDTYRRLLSPTVLVAKPSP